MKIIFASNYYNHHQSAISKSFLNHTRGRYVFVATGKMREERKSLGYSSEEPDFVCHIPRTKEGAEELTALCEMDDILIAGSLPAFMLSELKRSKRFFFKYSEHPFKKQLPFPKRILRLLKLIFNHRNTKRVHMLCASSHAAKDFASCGLYKGRTYKWGYFPETKVYPSIDDIMQNKNRLRILWCGRFIDWKHPDDVIAMAELLKKKGYNFELDFIGTGEMKDELLSLVEEKGLSDEVRFLGSMPPEKVRENMEQAGIFLFTSDRQEGWGAVLNEAMNSGCAVVASDLAGSTGYLINDNNNGFIYQSGNISELCEKVVTLLEDTNLQKDFGRNAYKTITEEWNAEIATQRFLELASHIVKGEKHPDIYKTGPCSKV